MIIQHKNPLKNSDKGINFFNFALRSLKALSYITFLLLVILILQNRLFVENSFSTVLNKVENRILGDSEYRPTSFSELLSYSGGAINNMLENNDYPAIKLSVEHESLLNIYNQSIEGIDRQYYSAKLVFTQNNEDQKMKLKIRGKGDRKIHFEDINSMSFRANLKGQDRIFGVEEFSLQDPIMRNYTWEYLIADTFLNQRLLTVRSWPVYFYVNGDSKGIYSLEEVPSKETIEQQKRKNGPIFGLDEKVSVSIDSKLDPYELKYWESNPMFIGSKNLLYESFSSSLNGEAFSSEVFDMEEWAKYFALIDLFGAFHGAVPKSVKFYYNPVDGLFQPLLFDAHLGAGDFNNFILLDFVSGLEKTACEWICQDKEFFISFLKNKQFLESYLRYLKEFSSSPFLLNIQDAYNDKFKKLDNHFYANLSPSDAVLNRGLSLYYFKMDRLRARQKQIINKLKVFTDKQPVNNYKPNVYASRLDVPSGVEVITIKDFNLSGDYLNIQKPTIYIFEGTSTKLSGKSADQPMQINGPGMFIFESNVLDLSNVIFSGSIFIPIANRNLSGAINIINSNVSLSDVSIINSKAEDAINLVSSSFEIDKLSVDGSFSDAVDLDFSSGVIKKLFCMNIGNDCLDISEANVTVQNIEVFNAEDKAISAGENTNLFIDKIDIFDSAIGLVSKDGSKLEVKNANFNDVVLPIAVFQKKASYKDPFIRIDSAESDDEIFGFFNDEINAQVPSSVTKKFLSSDEIEALLYGSTYGKATVK